VWNADAVRDALGAACVRSLRCGPHRSGRFAAFLKAVPKGGDLHNHLVGAVYAETYLAWAKVDGDCIDMTTMSVALADQCSTSHQPVPTSGSFYDELVRAWSMKDFVPGAQTGRDHFFMTFRKFMPVALAHSDDSIADVLTRAADDNVLYVETMTVLGQNVGSVAAAAWSKPVTAADLPALYDAIIGNPGFPAALASDVAEVRGTGYRTRLGCSSPSPPAACKVGVRFIAQVARNGPLAQLFGQLVSAYEMAAVTPQIVGATLSSPEDHPMSLANYELQMAMLDLLHGKYTATGRSPLHLSLHAGELTPKFLPAGSTANTFHIRHAVETGHAERIGHGIDVLSETDPDGLMDMLKSRNVLVEVCLSSNDQILEVKGAAHPLAQYLAKGVPFALATDDQGVSRSSMTGEYARAALEQHLDYRQLKTAARTSLEHAFLPGASLWRSVAQGQPVAECAATDTMRVGDPASGACEQFLADSERARMQRELERRFLAFEGAQQ